MSKRRSRYTSQYDQNARHARRLGTVGTQRITVHGREEVVVVSVEEYRRVKGERTGKTLVELLQDSPLREVTIDHEPTYAPVRGVEL